MERPDKTGRFDPLIWIHIVVAGQPEKLRLRITKSYVSTVFTVICQSQQFGK